MAYRNRDFGQYDESTGKGSLWEALPVVESAALRIEVLKPGYLTMSSAEILAALQRHELGGDATRTVENHSVAKSGMIRTVGFGGWGQLLAAAQGGNAVAAGVLQLLNQVEFFDPTTADFIGVMGALVQGGVWDQDVVNRLLALGHSVEDVPDSERTLLASVQEVIGLGGWGLTEEDIEEVR